MTHCIKLHFGCNLFILRRAMQLTRYTDLGLRVLMYLARAERDRIVTIAEVASQFDVPHNHLVKVVGHLGRLGWVAAARGRRGGLRLGVSPASLRVGAVVRALEGEQPVVDCDRGPGLLRGDCRLDGAFREALAAFYAALDRYTLADVIAQPTGEAIERMHLRYLAAMAAE